MRLDFLPPSSTHTQTPPHYSHSHTVFQRAGYAPANRPSAYQSAFESILISASSRRNQRLRRKRKNAEEKERRAKFKRGEPLATKQLPDRKLKGKLRYSEKLAGEAAAEAAQADEWLLPAEAGVMEAEGLERTWRFSQDAIMQGAHPSCSPRKWDAPGAAFMKVACKVRTRRVFPREWDASGAAFTKLACKVRTQRLA